MKVTRKDLSETSVELKVVVPETDAQNHFERAAKKIAIKAKVKGFRPGKAPYSVIKQQFGEMAIYQEAAEAIINDYLIGALKQEDLEIVGNPDIKLDKLAPGNEIEFTATVDLMPKVTLPKKWKDLEVKVEKPEVEDDKVQQVLQDLANMRAQDTDKDGAAADTDKVIIDLEVLVDGVVIENGVSKNFEVLLGSGRMIAGFEEALVGVKKGDKKKFNLTFPSEYFKKDLRDKEATFKVEVKEVKEVSKPEINDDFAKTLNYKSLEELTKLVKENLEHEKMHEVEGQSEVKMFELLIEKSKFTTIGDNLLNIERDKMIQELQQNIARQGMKYEDYLQHMGKTEDEMKEEFTDDAIKRIKTTLIMREIRKVEDIKSTDEEVVEELNTIIQQQPKERQAEVKKQVDTPHYRHYLRGVIETRKTAAFVKEQILSYPEAK